MKKMVCIAFSALIVCFAAACNVKEQDYSSIEPPEIAGGSIEPSEVPDPIVEDFQDTEKLEQESEVKIGGIRRKIESNSDIFYEVLYKIGDSEEYQTGYMNRSGVISPDPSPILYENFSGSFVLYDKYGNKTYSSEEDGNGGILYGTDKEVYLAQKMEAGIDGYVTYIGLIDGKGNWLSGSPIDVNAGANYPIAASGAEELGEGMLSAYFKMDNGNYLFLFDTTNGNIISIPDVWNDNLSFCDGTMIFQHWGGGFSGGHKGDICSVDKAGNITTLSVEGDLLAANADGFLTDADGLTYFTRNGVKVWNFEDYELSDEFTPTLYEDCVFAYFKGKDWNSYLGCISCKTGELIYEPFVENYGYIYEHSVFTNISGENCFVDLLTGEKIATLPDFDFNSSDVEYYSDGLFIINSYKDGKYNELFYDPKGNQVQPVLKYK